MTAQISRLTSFREAGSKRQCSGSSNSKVCACGCWASSAMPTARQGPSACHPRPHFTSALCQHGLCLPQRSQGSWLGWQSCFALLCCRQPTALRLPTSKSSAKPSAGRQTKPREQRGLRRFHANSPQPFASPQLDSCFQPAKRPGKDKALERHIMPQKMQRETPACSASSKEQCINAGQRGRRAQLATGPGTETAENSQVRLLKT